MKNKSIASLAVVVLHAASITEGSDTPTAFASFSSDCRRGCLPVEWIPANYFSRRRQSHSNTPLHPARSQNIATQRRPLSNARPSATASIFHSHLEDSEGEPEFFTQHTPKPPKKRKSKRVDLSFIRPGDLNDVDDTERNIVFGNNEVTKQPGKDRLARAAASLMAQREKRETVKKPSYSSSTQRAIAKNNLRRASEPMQNNINNFDDEGYVENNMSGDLVGLTKKIDQKILSANWSRSGQKRRVNDKSPGIEGHVQHAT